MPIEQQRLFDLLNTAEQLRNLYINTCQQAESLVSRIAANGTITQSDLDLATSLFHAPEYMIVAETETLIRERTRYNHTWRRNRAEKNRKARQRANGTIPLSQLLRTSRGRQELITGIKTLPPAPSSAVDPEFAREYQEYLRANPQFQDLADSPVPSAPTPDVPMPQFDNEHTLQSTASMLDQDDSALDEALAQEEISE